MEQGVFGLVRKVAPAAIVAGVILFPIGEARADKSCFSPRGIASTYCTDGTVYDTYVNGRNTTIIERGSNTRWTKSGDRALKSDSPGAYMTETPDGDIWMGGVDGDDASVYLDLLFDDSEDE